MPALPWLERQPIDPKREYVAMASRLPLKSYGSIPGFLRDTMQVRRQLAQTPGLVGYTLNAGLARKTFLTFSVWEDQASLDRFAAADPHRSIIAGLRPRMNPTKFEFFPVSGTDLPLSWEQIAARLS
jgi:heme-degrading monooxygenase HmoA